MGLKRAARALRAAFLGLLAAIALFLLLAWIGSSVPRNPPTPAVEDGIELLIETNGTHTGIVMPIVTAEKDWRATFPSASAPVGGRMPTHIAVGWGEREVFLHVAQWADLKSVTALRIAAMGGSAVMRVSHYVRPAPSENYRPVTISRAAYVRMTEAIEQSLAPSIGPRQILRGSNPADAYYDALGHYTLAYTCNNWVGDMLAEADVQMGRWTPFPGGVMKWIEWPETS